MAIERVAPTWITRSTSPMSMPSSSEAVATSARSWPALSRCSASSRRSRERLPWWLVTASSPRSLRELGGDALGHLARVHEHERRAVLADQLGHALVDLLPLLVGADGGQRRGRDLDAPGRARGTCPRPPARSRGPRPTRNRPTSSSGFCVAERPMRWTGRPASASSRSSESARWLPRLSRTSAWISSTITVRTLAQHAAARPRWSAGGRATPAWSPGCAAAGASWPRARRRRVAGAHQHADLGQGRVGARGSRPAGPAGSSARRWTARAAARRRGPGSASGRSAPWRRSAVDRGQERGQRLARARGRGDQRVAPRPG